MDCRGGRRRNARVDVEAMDAIVNGSRGRRLCVSRGTQEDQLGGRLVDDIAHEQFERVFGTRPVPAEAIEQVFEKAFSGSPVDEGGDRAGTPAKRRLRQKRGAKPVGLRGMRRVRHIIAERPDRISPELRIGFAGKQVIELDNLDAIERRRLAVEAMPELAEIRQGRRIASAHNVHAGATALRNRRHMVDRRRCFRQRDGARRLCSNRAGSKFHRLRRCKRRRATLRICVAFGLYHERIGDIGQVFGSQLAIEQRKIEICVFPVRREELTHCVAFRLRAEDEIRDGAGSVDHVSWCNMWDCKCQV